MNSKKIPDIVIAEESLRQSNASLRIINMISSALHLSLDFDTVAKKAAKAMDDFFHAPSVSIFMLNEKESRLDQVFASDPDIEPARLIRTLPLKKGSITALTVARKEIIICEDVSKDKIMRPDVRAAIIKWGRKTILSMPLLFHNQILGAMNLFFAEKRTFTQIEQETFLSIGKTIGLALTNARHVSQLREEIAERKKVERALRESQEHMEELVRERTKELIFANNELLDEIAERKCLEEALIKSEEKYRLITENIMDCIALADAKGIFQYVTYSREILGYEPEEMIGKTGLNITHPDEKPRIKKLYKEGIEKGWHEIIYQTKLRHKDGHYISMDVRARTLFDPQGNVIGAVFAGRDVAQVRQLNDEILCGQKAIFAGDILSPREKEILIWVMQGKSTWDIATILKISERTVKFHVDNVLKKLSAVNRTQAVAIALRDKLI